MDSRSAKLNTSNVMPMRTNDDAHPDRARAVWLPFREGRKGLVRVRWGDFLKSICRACDGKLNAGWPRVVVWFPASTQDNTCLQQMLSERPWFRCRVETTDHGLFVTGIRISLPLFSGWVFSTASTVSSLDRKFFGA